MPHAAAASVRDKILSKTVTSSAVGDSTIMFCTNSYRGAGIGAADSKLLVLGYSVVCAGAGAGLLPWRDGPEPCQARRLAACGPRRKFTSPIIIISKSTIQVNY